MKKKILSIVLGVLVVDLLLSAFVGVFSGMLAGALENGAGSQPELGGMIVFGFLCFVGTFVTGLKLGLAALVTLAVGYVIGGVMVRWLRPDKTEPGDGDDTSQPPRGRGDRLKITVKPPERMEKAKSQQRYKLDQLMYLLQQARTLQAQSKARNQDAELLLEEAKEACLLAGMTMDNAEPKTIIAILIRESPVQQKL